MMLVLGQSGKHFIQLQPMQSTVVDHIKKSTIDENFADEGPKLKRI
jgi:hypothetical protein